MLTTQFDRSKIFIGNNEYVDRTYTNSTGDTVTLSAGRVMGTITASGKLAPQDKDSSDGSQLGRYIMADTYEVEDGETVTISVVRGGRVAAEQVSFGSGETASTANGTTGTNGDILYALGGISLISTTNLTSGE